MKIKNIFFTMACAGILYSCHNDESAKGTARFELRLTDAPAAYASVVVALDGIYVRVNGQKNEIELDELVDHRIDLLELTNGADTLLAGQDMPVGRIAQIRLVLDSDNYVVVAGVKHTLETPSAMQSGLKLNVQGGHYV